MTHDYFSERYFSEERVGEGHMPHAQSSYGPRQAFSTAPSLGPTSSDTARSDLSVSPESAPADPETEDLGDADWDIEALEAEWEDERPLARDFLTAALADSAPREARERALAAVDQVLREAVELASRVALDAAAPAGPTFPSDAVPVTTLSGVFEKRRAISDGAAGVGPSLDEAAAEALSEDGIAEGRAAKDEAAEIEAAEIEAAEIEAAEIEAAEIEAAEFEAAEIEAHALAPLVAPPREASRVAGSGNTTPGNEAMPGDETRGDETRGRVDLTGGDDVAEAGGLAAAAPVTTLSWAGIGIDGAPAGWAAVSRAVATPAAGPPAAVTGGAVTRGAVTRGAAVTRGVGPRGAGPRAAGCPLSTWVGAPHCHGGPMLGRRCRSVIVSGTAPGGRLIVSRRGAGSGISAAATLGGAAALSAASARATSSDAASSDAASSSGAVPSDLLSRSRASNGDAPLNAAESSSRLRDGVATSAFNLAQLAAAIVVGIVIGKAAHLVMAEDTALAWSSSRNSSEGGLLPEPSRALNAAASAERADSRAVFWADELEGADALRADDSAEEGPRAVETTPRRRKRVASRASRGLSSRSGSRASAPSRVATAENARPTAACALVPAQAMSMVALPPVPSPSPAPAMGACPTSVASSVAPQLAGAATQLSRGAAPAAANPESSWLLPAIGAVAPSSDDWLGDQLAILSRAERSLLDGNPESAVRALDEYRTRFPSGLLDPQMASVRQRVEERFTAFIFP